MKRTIGLVTVMAALVALTGCRTVTTQTPTGTVTSTRVDPQAVATIVSVAVPPAVQIAVGQDTNCIPYLRAAQVAISAAVSGGVYDPVTLDVTLNAISIKELRTTEAQAAVQAGLAVYQAFFGQAVKEKIASSGYGVVLQAVADGIGEGLARPPIVLSRVK